jgi:tetratricopeptide (TPR) repeat protein
MDGSMPLEPLHPRHHQSAPRIRPLEPTARVRITLFDERATAPAISVGRITPRTEALARWSALASAALLIIGTVGWAPLTGFLLHGLSDYHFYNGREALKRGEPQIAVQREWQRAIALDPTYASVRLALARSYIDDQWYGGAASQAQAVLNHRHRTRREASLAYTYLGYAHYMLGDHAEGEAELALAIDYDPQNSLAQSVIERLRLQGKLPPL